MMDVPIKTHLKNFIVKLALFLTTFFIFQYLHLFSLPLSFLFLLPLFFTAIGMIADWVIVPKFHNLISTIAGAVFMGITTYLVTFFIAADPIPLKAILLLTLFLGMIEAVLHILFVKPYLHSS